MKKRIFYFLLFLIALSCNDNGKQPVMESENDIDAARNFIKASLERDWPKAKTFLLADLENMERIETIGTFFTNEKSEDRKGYKEASINIHDIRKVNDSVSVIHYSNSYMNKKDSLKIILINGQWLVDLKYSFLPIDTVRSGL